jgi:hypothetical protein
MKRETWLTAAAGALALGLMGSSVQAAPAGGPVAELKSEAAQSSEVHEAAWRRRCWWHRGHQHCRRYWDDYGYYGDGYPYYGYGPGVGFFFGGGGGHHHGHFHRGGGGRGHGHHGRGHGGRGRH